ncbi:hypothetical protein SKAU_G00321470 [Synaphobranchus kaupii]|uniref:Uncharacterized protein n=1 Tax=Synaphobranchus kaupii TaxID=118154 RepID=A0A9Q1ENV3_SYNKA|nr:hypothetical protein SKAU_G00321470 [Synaphobranchus kaupii]
MTTLTLNRTGGQELGAKKDIAVTSSLGQAKDGRQLPILEVKDGQRKKKKKNDKKKSTSGAKKRGHSSTPSNSDDADKTLTEAVSSSSSMRSGPEVEKPAVRQAKVKGQPARPRSEKESRKIQEQEGEGQTVATPPDPPPAPPPEDVGSSVQDQESLRWKDVLADPLAEEERLEIYRANRRRRYYLSAQQKQFGETTPTLGQEWGHFIQGGEGRA